MAATMATMAAAVVFCNQNDFFRGEFQMKGCELAGQCSFFQNLAQQEDLADYFLSLFCEGNFTTCARYEAALDTAGTPVPEWIFPNEKDFLSLFATTIARVPS